MTDIPPPGAEEVGNVDILLDSPRAMQWGDACTRAGRAAERIMAGVMGGHKPAISEPVRRLILSGLIDVARVMESELQGRTELPAVKPSLLIVQGGRLERT